MSGAANAEAAHSDHSSLMNDGVNQSPSVSPAYNETDVGSVARTGSVFGRNKIEGIDVVAENISFVADADGEKKMILNKVCLAAKRGEVFAIMGPSGSGKTSLLNILAGRTRAVMKPESQFIESDPPPKKRPQPYGQVYLNGHSVDYGEIAKQSRYVMQADCLLPYLSVRETLHFGSILKLSHLSIDERQAKVDQILSELSLHSCLDVVVGDSVHKGISGGQKKRLAIALELLDDPALLYLDEPTSGLDSSLAFDVVSTLHTMANHGRTIVATIHQPRSQIFSLFDKLLLLSLGEVVYHGTAKQAGEFTASIGLPVPKSFNAADFFLDILAVDEAEDAEFSQESLMQTTNLEHSIVSATSSAVSQGVRQRRRSVDATTLAREASEAGRSLSHALSSGLNAFPDALGPDVRPKKHGSVRRPASHEKVTLAREIVSTLPGRFKASKWHEELEEMMKAMKATTSPLAEDDPMAGKNALLRWFKNVGTLAHREIINRIRNPFGLILGIFVTSVMNIIVALLYWRVDKPVDCLSFFNWLGALTFIGINNSFNAMQHVIEFPKQKPMFNREVAGGLYKPSAFFIGYNIGQFPFLLILPTISVLISYWSVGFGQCSNV